VDWWGLARRRLGKPARKALDSLFVLVSWTIWLERNARVFRSSSSSPAQVTTSILEQIDTWISACYHSLLPFSEVVAGRRNDLVAL
jgi:hypothetical protein